MADPGAPLEDLSGTIIDNRYQILERETQGGMGAIYRARHVALENLVALKVMLKPRNLREQERFLQEAQLASKIRHPNTVYLSDFGILSDGQPYLVMEFLSGRTLSQDLQEAPFPPRRVCHIGAQIARGLQAVHEKGIVHRDLKPATVTIERETKYIVPRRGEVLENHGLRSGTIGGSSRDEGGSNSCPGCL